MQVTAKKSDSMQLYLCRFIISPTRLAYIGKSTINCSFLPCLYRLGIVSLLKRYKGGELLTPPRNDSHRQIPSCPLL